MTFKELKDLIESHFLVADKGVLKLICAICIAHLYKDTNPVWLFLIAPPSGLKSELIRGLSKLDNVYPISSLTPQTFISGQRSVAKENSLLRRIGDGILTFKDFTTVLQLYEAARQEILSQLREIYDGQYSKPFGNGEEISWEGKITFIAGVTEAVDMYSQMYSILGERFLQYRMIQPDRKEATKVALANSMSSDAIRLAVADAFADYLGTIEIPEELPPVDDEWKQEIIELADFATRGRTGVRRDSKDREITHVFESEMPMRFSQQLILLAQTFTLMGYEDGDKEILRKIAVDSLPKNRIKVFAVMSSDTESDAEMAIVSDTLGIAEVKQGFSTAEIGTLIGMPTGTTRRILEDLNALGFLDRTKKGEHANSEDVWTLKEEWKNLINNYLKQHLNAFPKN